MSILLADVGGTNTRLARLTPQGQVTGVARFANDDFAGFQAVLQQYDPHGIRACLIAIAGPVTASRARLTNRDWSFDRDGIARTLGLSGAGQVLLLNDLAALGHALGGLRPDQWCDMRVPDARVPGNGQALVMGLGTGFNVALVKRTGQGAQVIEAELGHAGPSYAVVQTLMQDWGPAAMRFQTNESIFSGQGLSQLHQLTSGGALRDGAEILAAYDHDPEAAQTVCRVADLLGLLTRDLILTYLPFDGIYLAGAVARGLLGSPAQRQFLTRLSAPGRLDDHSAAVPIRLIADDAAALGGLAQVARASFMGAL